MKWYLKVLEQYADFSGRARRKEFWMFVLFHMLIIVLIMIPGNVFGSSESSGIILFYVYILATIIPSLAVCVRRLHDIGKSGWYYFIGLFPIIGELILLIWYCTDSKEDENKWGKNPKEQ